MTAQYTSAADVVAAIQAIKTPDGPATMGASDRLAIRSAAAGLIHHLAEIAAPTTHNVILAALVLESDTYAVSDWSDLLSDDAIIFADDAFQEALTAAQKHHDNCLEGGM